jgi:colanic acid biosynthesis glycosyl transferase WcaI
MRILFVNRSFWPDTDATGVLLNELTEDLALKHQITVICGPANTPTSRRSLLPFTHENHGSVRIVRTFGARLSKRNLPVRFMNLALYYALAAIAAFRERADVIIAETDPPLLGVLGAMVKRMKNCRFVYYCQDLFPDIATANGGLKSRPLLALLRWCNDVAYHHADAIVVLGSDMLARLRSRGVSGDRTTIIPNWIDCQKVQPLPALGRLRRNRDDFVVMYAGNMGWSQNLETVLQTARLMQADRRVKFVLVGDGAKKTALEREATAKCLDNVEFIDRQPPGDMNGILATGDLHLIPLVAGSAGCLVPSKVYGILAAGRPYVAMMEADGEVARLASEFEVGFVTPPENAGALAETIAGAMKDPERLRQMGRRARALAEEAYDRRLVTRRFADFLETIGPNPSTTPGLPASPRGPALEADPIAPAD